MSHDQVVGLAGALGVHLLVLFGLRTGTPAKPLPVRDEPVEVSLVAPAPEPVAPAVEPPPPPPEPPPPAPPPPEAVPPPPEPQVMQKPERDEESKPPPPAPKPRPERTRPAAPSTLPRTVAPPPASGPAVSAHPRYRSNPKPDYPMDARRLHQEGTVLLSVEVSADGHAESVSLKRSSGFPSLDQAAIQAVRHWTFEPGRTGGVAVASRVDVPVRFSLSDFGR